MVRFPWPPHKVVEKRKGKYLYRIDDISCMTRRQIAKSQNSKFEQG